MRPGDPLSPNLFNALLEEILRELNWANFGTKIARQNLNHLRFADDIVLISKNLKELETMANELEKTSNRMGLTMNLEITKLSFSGEKASLKFKNPRYNDQKSRKI